MCTRRHSGLRVFLRNVDEPVGRVFIQPTLLPAGHKRSKYGSRRVHDAEDLGKVCIVRLGGDDRVEQQHDRPATGEDVNYQPAGLPATLDQPVLVATALPSSLPRTRWSQRSHLFHREKHSGEGEMWHRREKQQAPQHPVVTSDLWSRVSALQDCGQTLGEPRGCDHAGGGGRGRE